MQRNSQEEISNGRGPPRAEENRGTEQGTSGSQVFFFLFFIVLFCFVLFVFALV